MPVTTQAAPWAFPHVKKRPAGLAWGLGALPGCLGECVIMSHRGCGKPGERGRAAPAVSLDAQDENQGPQVSRYTRSRGYPGNSLGDDPADSQPEGPGQDRSPATFSLQTQRDQERATSRAASLQSPRDPGNAWLLPRSVLLLGGSEAAAGTGTNHLPCLSYRNGRTARNDWVHAFRPNVYFGAWAGGVFARCVDSRSRARYSRPPGLTAGSNRQASLGSGAGSFSPLRASQRPSLR